MIQTSFLIKDIDKDKLYEFLREMEFNRLLSQAISFYGDPNNDSSISEIKSKKITSKIDTKSYKSIINEKELNELIKNLNEKSIIAVDTETSSINPQEAELIGISISYATNASFYIPLGHKNTKRFKKEFSFRKTQNCS